ncbi:acyl-CoA dehydrogenase family protein [Pendulispora rubella]|uniref:Acyl-CoA dehydrogenase family protein n=1 Tax=Pendulispora rubella TaxID=2741070 RepID=A0ABZ2KST9_9BACT
MTTQRTKLLEDPELRPFLPLLWVAWSDGDLEQDDLVALRSRVEAMPWLRPAARHALETWLAPDAPPSQREMRTLLDTIHKVSATLSPERRRDLAGLGAELADEGTRRALAELEDALGGGAASELFAHLATAEASRTREAPPKPTAPFDVSALGAWLDGDVKMVRDQARTFLADPEHRAYGLPVPEYRAKVAHWLADLAARGFGQRAYPGITSDEKDLNAFIATFETLAMGDLSLVIRFGVQFGLFGGSIFFLGTEAQRHKWLSQVASLDLPGCFAMSEVGHGSDVQSLETRATWDVVSRTFVLHTPAESARKDWVGGAAQHARMATVFAQLEADGEGHGIHAFLVPIRDAQGKLLEGVRAGDSGHKMGLNGVDNGRLWFDHVRVPEHALLGRFAWMNAEGHYESAIANPKKRFFTMLGTLVGGRISVATASVAAAKVGLAIAVRYASARRQFGPEDGVEMPLLDYPAHQRRLLPRLATTYVLSLAVARLRSNFGQRIRDDEAGDTRELEASAAALKALASWHAVETLRECRQACGGQGYLLVNRLPDLCADVEVFTTFEGDNTVLLQLVAKSLLTGFKKRFESTGVAGIARHLLSKARVAVTEKNLLAVRRTDPEHLRDRAFHLAAFKYREERLLETAAARLRKRLEANRDAHAAMLAVQEHLVALARAHADRLALQWFDESIADCSDAQLVPWLDRIGALHALTRLREEAAFFLAEGYFDAQKEHALRKETTALLGELRQGAVALVDAFGIPDACLAAPIAFMDPAHPRW